MLSTPGLVRRWTAGALAAVAVCTAVFGERVAAAAGPIPPAAFGVLAASLSQDGRRLSWTVTLDHDFSGGAFRRGRRTLCLWLERRSPGAMTGRLCVLPPARRGRTLRLTFARVTARGPGRARVVAATITRGGRDELTASLIPTDFDPGYRALRWQVRSTVAGGACAAPAVAAVAPCSIAFPARPALARLHTPVLVGCVASGRSLVFGGSQHRHEIALTFDDGPWGTPPSIDFVNLLARYHVPATFFEIGSQISRYDPTGAIERRMLADGDMIGDHTWTHPDMLTLPPAAQTAQLRLTADAIRRATGFTPCLWRPPYGAISPRLDSLARGLGFLTIYWNVDTRDWSLPGVASIERTALSNASNGAIVLMHFGGGPRYETYAALPTIITALRSRGYRFVNVAQLLGLRMIYR